MTKRLGDSDRRAVDLLLDRSAGTGNGDGNGSSYVAHAQPGTEPSIQGVQRVLNLLDLLPAGEPSEDLIARTMARIGGQAGVGTQPMHPATAAMMTNRPHA